MTVLLVVMGKLCELMVTVDSEIYWQYVTTGRQGRPMLYMQLLYVP